MGLTEILILWVLVDAGVKQNVFYNGNHGWNKHYFVITSCCNTLYGLDSAIGKRIARGEEIEILVTKKRN